MKKNLYMWFTIGAILIALPALSQKKVVVVEPDKGIEIGALNNAIKNESDPGNTIFELKRGSLYLLNGTVSHSGYTLHIRAEEGEGTRPILQPAVDQLGNSGVHFTSGGSLILEGLHLFGFDELGSPKDRHVVVTGQNSRFIFEDMYHDYSNQSIIRLQTLNNYVSFNNSTFRNVTRPQNPSNGSIIDTRSNPQDTLIITNSTIYNTGTEILRLANAFVKYLNFDHNTMWATNLRWGFNINKIYKANVTNNLFYNAFYYCPDYGHNPVFGCDSIHQVGDYNDAGRYFNLTNNNWYIDPVIGEILDEYGKTNTRYDANDVDKTNPIPWRMVTRTNVFADQAILDTLTVTSPPDIIKFIKNGQVDTTNIFSEKLTFKNSPPLNLDYWQFYVENEFSISDKNPPTAYADEDPEKIEEVTTGAFDFSYNASSRSAKAANGLPLGDPRWMPYTPVYARQISSESTKRVITFPNPFIDQVTFELEAQKSSPMRLIIYNMLGKEVLTLKENLVTGKNQVTFNLGSVLKQGIYLFQVQAETVSGYDIISSGKIIRK